MDEYDEIENVKRWTEKEAGGDRERLIEIEIET